MIVKNLLPREFDRAEKILTLTRQNTQESVWLPGLSSALFLGFDGKAFRVASAAARAQSAPDSVSSTDDARITYHNGTFFLIGAPQHRVLRNELPLTPGTEYSLRVGDRITLHEEPFLVDSIDTVSYPDSARGEWFEPAIVYAGPEYFGLH